MKHTNKIQVSLIVETGGTESYSRVNGTYHRGQRGDGSVTLK
jgi:hypothetical protein